MGVKGGSLSGRRGVERCGLEGKGGKKDKGVYLRTRSEKDKGERKRCNWKERRHK